MKMTGEELKKVIMEAALKELNLHRTDEGKSSRKRSTGTKNRKHTKPQQEEEILQLEPRRQQKIKDEGRVN